MKTRCNTPCGSDVEHYKGIIYEERWEYFENFLEDMGEKPEGMSMDRIDPGGNYTKENCRWADSNTQAYNTKIKSNNKSGRTGVTLNKRTNKWTAYIGYKGKHIQLGYFDTFEQAVKARELAEMEYYGYLKE